MIRVHIGAVEVHDSPNLVVIHVPQDYVPARLTIRSAIRNAVELDVFVLTRVCDEWFWDLEADPRVQLLREGPVQRLCEKLHVTSLPPELDDADLIVSMRLLSLPAPPSRSVPDVTAWVAGATLGEVWAMLHPSYDHLTQLLQWWAVNTVPDVLRPITEQRMRTWKDQVDGLLQEAYRAIEQNPIGVMLFVSSWTALKVYDEATRVRWLTEEGYYLPSLQWLTDKLGDIPLPLAAQKALSRKVEAYWRRRLLEIERGASS